MLERAPCGAVVFLDVAVLLIAVTEVRVLHLVTHGGSGSGGRLLLGDTSEPSPMTFMVSVRWIHWISNCAEKN